MINLQDVGGPLWRHTKYIYRCHGPYMFDNISKFLYLIFI